MSRVATAFGAGFRSYRRSPVLVALVLVLPAYAVGLYSYVAPEAPATVHLNDGAAAAVTIDRAFAAFTAPMAAALVAGIAGLFLIRSTADADGRLVQAGYSPWEVVIARLALIATVAAVASALAVGAALATFDPAHLRWFAAGTLLTALAYGLVGVLAGLAVGRLPGVYLLLFGSIIDLFLFQNPLATDRPAAATLLPGHFPVALTTEAAFGASVEIGLFGRSLAVIVALALLATVAFHRATRIG